MRLFTNRQITAVAFAILVAGVPRTAVAHARLVRSEPPERASLDHSPKRVRLWFNEPLEPKFVRLEVANEKGEAVTKSAAHVAPDDRKVLELELPPLPPGSYTATFEVLSIDGHRVKQSFPFTVKEHPSAK